MEEQGLRYAHLAVAEFVWSVPGSREPMTRVEY